MTDLLGTMLAWGASTTVVEAESGERVTIELADIVSGKPVPPRPSARLRVTAEEAERRALLGWPPVESEPLGSWVLRASAGFSARANSVLAVGSPGPDLDQAVEAVRAFYASRGLPAVGAGGRGVRPGGRPRRARLGHGATRRGRLRVPDRLRRPALPRPPPSRREWSPPPRRVGASGRREPAESARWSASVEPTASAAWLADDPRARATPEAARAVLEGPAEVGFVSVVEAGAAGPLVAKGRVSLADDWAGITDVLVAPDHRRQGLALVVMSALWSGPRNAARARRTSRPGATTRPHSRSTRGSASSPTTPTATSRRPAEPHAPGAARKARCDTNGRHPGPVMPSVRVIASSSGDRAPSQPPSRAGRDARPATALATVQEGARSSTAVSSGSAKRARARVLRIRSANAAGSARSGRTTSKYSRPSRRIDSSRRMSRLRRRVRRWFAPSYSPTTPATGSSRSATPTSRPSRVKISRFTSGRGNPASTSQTSRVRTSLGERLCSSA